VNESMTNQLPFNDILHPGQAWSRVLRRHQTLRLTTTAIGSSVALFAFNAHAPIERYNMPDTLKAQHTAFLTAGRVMMSDMGHVLLSVIDDSCGWHDTITGHGDSDESRDTFGDSSYQDHRNDRYRNTRDNVLLELAKHELGLRDLHANVNLFTKVVADADGNLAFVPNSAAVGSAVTLRAEMDTLIVLSNTPHPLDPTTVYAPPPVELTIERCAPPAADDLCRTSRPENARAFQLTEGLFA
jgi:uncharacterized protein